MKSILNYFTQPYEQQSEDKHIKAGHTAFMLLLICFSVLLEVIIGAFFTPTTLMDLLYDSIALIIFAFMLTLIRKGHLLLTGNLFVFAGFVKLLEFFNLSHTHQFYLQAFLGMIVCIAIYIKTYQLLLVFGYSLILTITRIFYILNLEFDTQLIKIHHIHETYQATAGVLIFAVAALFYDRVISREINVSHQLRSLSETDMLTLLYNRQKFNTIVKDLKAKDTQFCLALIDIDFFKNINDKYGHQTGDEILKTFALALRDSFEQSSLVFRWGGEEFAIVAKEHRDLQAFMDQLDSFRDSIASKDFNIDEQVTISIGYVCSDQFKNKDTVLLYADQALYNAKQDGRNKVAFIDKEDSL